MNLTSSLGSTGILLTVIFLAGCDRSSQSDVAQTRSEDLGAPIARIDVVQDEFYGESVDDPYRWLEDWDSEEVKAWSDGQNIYARYMHANFPRPRS